MTAAAATTVKTAATTGITPAVVAAIKSPVVMTAMMMAAVVRAAIIRTAMMVVMMRLVRLKFLDHPWLARICIPSVPKEPIPHPGQISMLAPAMP